VSNQFAIKEVYNLDICDYTTKKPFIRIDYAQTGTNDFAGDRTDIKGGWGNQRLYSFDASKTVDFKVTVPLVDIKLLAFLSGSEVATGARNIYQRDQLVVGMDNKITLSQTPIDGTLYVSNLESNRDYGTEITAGEPATTPNTYSISGKDITLNATSNPIGTSTVVVWYKYAAPETTQTIKFDADKFSKYCTIVALGKWDDQVEAVQYPAQLMIYKCRPQAEFTLTTSASDATTLDMTFDMYAEQVTEADNSIRNAYFDANILR
jgi:hypothetical protein